MRGTIALSWGQWGGFYLYLGGRGAITRRLCLGWFAITYVALEIDDLMEAWADQGDDYVAALEQA